MGLIVGAKVFNDILPGALRPGHPIIYTSDELERKQVDIDPERDVLRDAARDVSGADSRTRSVKLFVDIMTSMNSLGTAGKTERPPSVLVRVFVSKLLDMFMRTGRPLQAEMFLHFDDSTCMPKIKRHVQRRRDSASSTKPYEIPVGMEDEATITDDGLDLKDGNGPQNVNAVRLMRTRALRRRWYTYLRDKCATDKRLARLRVIFDYDRKTSYVCNGDGTCNAVQGLSLPIGEGEAVAMAMAVKHAEDNTCFLYSGDSDIIPLALMHMDVLDRHTFRVVINKGGARKAGVVPYMTLNPHALAARIHAQGWSVAGLVLGLVLSGTDFVQRRVYLRGVSKSATILAAWAFVHEHVSNAADGSHWERLCMMKDALCDPDAFDILVCTIYTWHHRHGTKKIHGKGWSPGPQNLVTIRSEQATIRLAGKKKVRHPGSDVARTGAWDAILANLEYWMSLQGQVDTSLCESRSLWAVRRGAENGEPGEHAQVDEDDARATVPGTCVSPSRKRSCAEESLPAKAAKRWRVTSPDTGVSPAV